MLVDRIPAASRAISLGAEVAPIRIVLADDHTIVREGIKSLLSCFSGLEVIAEAANGAELVQLAQALRPDIVLTDIEMPIMDGIAATEQIRRKAPEVKVVVLSMHTDQDDLRRAVTSGACGFVQKDAAPFELEHAIWSVVREGKCFGPQITQRLLQPREPTPYDELTDRQVEILKLLASGRAAKEIGYELGLSSKTIDVHRSHIMQRLQLFDIASLTRYSIRKGLITA